MLFPRCDTRSKFENQVILNVIFVVNVSFYFIQKIFFVSSVIAPLLLLYIQCAVVVGFFGLLCEYIIF